MVSMYGDAWIELLYDINTEVRITNPSEEVKKVHNLKPKKYLVLSGTDKKFPEGVLIGFDEIKYEPKTVITQGERCPKYDRIKLEELSEGGVYPVTLIQRTIHIEPELERMGIHRIDTFNQLTFNPGELEERLSSTKKEFLAKIETSGISPEEEKVYYRIVATGVRF